MTKLTDAQHADIKRELERRFPNHRVGRPHWEELLLTYGSSGLAPPNLVVEVTCGDDAKFWAHVWEAMLYRHLSCLGLAIKGRVPKAGQFGPDFRIEHQTQTIWIEAVTPAPEGIPQEWLSPPKKGEVKGRRKPHNEMLLRWMSVLKDKREKLETYAKKGIISATDCTVIAVNCCRLSDFAMDDLGISRLPRAVEAGFPIGPLAVPITSDGQQDGEPSRVPRHEIRKPNGADVPTGNFLDPRYANVSAVMGCYRKEMADGVLPLTIVHNPLAKACLPRGILGADKEYVADDKGDHYLVRTLSGGPE